ncbi:MAG: hypothetical protein DRR06_01800 [Gammaproteobacteria bacterium]|nr:MAG: hypothetical protein DRR06_01800 [Gammaproteobacteria bacterium]RLA50140.1 MAG: hypothetical protein DRR42_13955 [Gammaproteobacteria bacterium]
MKRIFLGFAPGGTMAFGWFSLVLADDDKITEFNSGTCSTAGEAFDAAASTVSNYLPAIGIPLAIGIAAPMYWSANAERNADNIVRGCVLSRGGPSSTVSSVNSLRGACLAQGVMVAALTRERWPEVLITESHPGALLTTWPKVTDFLSRLDFNNDHERDAALCAYAALAYDKRCDGWRDLRAFESRTFELIPGTPPVYWFPAGNT